MPPDQPNEAKALMKTSCGSCGKMWPKRSGPNPNGRSSSSGIERT